MRLFKLFRRRIRIQDGFAPSAPLHPVAVKSAGSKMVLCWIGIGDYNAFFREMYESFNARFCSDMDRTFFVFTDQPERYVGMDDVVVYEIPHACTHKDFILFRKWKYLLLAEDRYPDYDYVAFVNGNMVCKENVLSSEVVDPQRPLAIITHPCDKWIRHGTWICSPKSQAGFAPRGDWQYKQAGFNISTAHEFLKMANTIEAWRHLDKATGGDLYVPWHDETYANRYFYENRERLNVLDGKIYCFPCGVPGLEDRFGSCKLYTRSKAAVVKGGDRAVRQDAYTLALPGENR